MNVKYALICFLSAAAALHSVPTRAQDVGQHPAVFAARKLPAVDPSTFIVGHPAAPTAIAGHSNNVHPAVAAKAAVIEINSDTYLVQPPTSTRWTLGAAEPVAGQQLAQRPTLVR